MIVTGQSSKKGIGNRLNKKILIIDEHSDMRRLIRMTLEFEGYEVIEASSGKQGLSFARQQGPDLILLDIVMPGMDGIEFIGILKADLKLCDVPVVLLTALDPVLQSQDAINAGAMLYVTKPFHPVELLANIDLILNKEIENKVKC